jgi:Trypsin-co-occurring domain 1
MSELVEVRTDAGPVLFDSDNLTAVGPEQVGRRGKNIVAQLDQRLDDTLASVRPAADAVIRTFQPLAPHELIVEFGLRLDAEAGAVIAKTGLAGHFTITMKWAPDQAHPQQPSLA